MFLSIPYYKAYYVAKGIQFRALGCPQPHIQASMTHYHMSKKKQLGNPYSKWRSCIKKHWPFNFRCHYIVLWSVGIKVIQPACVWHTDGISSRQGVRWGTGLCGSADRRWGLVARAVLLGCPVCTCILSHLGSALPWFSRGFLSDQSSTAALGYCGVPRTWNSHAHPRWGKLHMRMHT